MKPYTLYSLLIVLVFGSALAQQEPTFSSQSNLVLVPTMVRDGKGNIIYGLHAQDFIVDDDGIAQEVHLDEAAESSPVSLMIAVQCGRRAWREFSRIRGLAAMLDPVVSERVTRPLCCFLTASSTCYATSPMMVTESKRI